MVTPIVSSCLETEICDKFKINALTEPQKCSMSAVIEGSDVFVSTQTESGKSLNLSAFSVTVIWENCDCYHPINYNYGRADQKTGGTWVQGNLSGTRCESEGTD